MAFQDAVKCTATSKRSGKPCQNPAVLGYTVCRMHGAGNKTTPGGRPVTKGITSTKLPKDLAERVSEILADEHLLDLREDIAIVRAHREELIERAGSGESSALWQELVNSVYELEAAQRRGDMETAKIVLPEILRRIKQGASKDRAWKDIGELDDRIGRLVLSEHRIMNDSRNSIRADQAHALVMALTHIVMENVTDTATRTNIAKAMSKLLGAPVIEGNLVSIQS